MQPTFADLQPLPHLHAGMLFDGPGGDWVVVAEGDYEIVAGVRQSLDNARGNKWYCRPVAGGEPALHCFDAFWTDHYNFHEAT